MTTCTQGALSGFNSKTVFGKSVCSFFVCMEPLLLKRSLDYTALPQIDPLETDERLDDAPEAVSTVDELDFIFEEAA